MKKLNYKLIVSDFDGTLANSLNEVPERVVKTVNDYVRFGGAFAVCTGRILPCILPRVKQMGLEGLVVASQGSQIAEIDSGKIIKCVGFSDGEAAEICAFLEEQGCNIQLYFTDGFYSSLPADNPYLNKYEDIIGLKSLHTKGRISSVCRSSDKLFCKVAVLVDKNERDELYKKLYSRFSPRFDVTCSAAVLIEISPKGETKGSALKFLADRYDIPIEKTIAIGDNLNDISMIEAAGVGVAVKNGEEALKEAADVIAPANDECAVAEIIERFGYSNG